MNLLLVLLFLLCTPISVVAQTPVISGVTGTVSDGSSIIISGSLFGDNGPTIQLFDNFESGTNGVDIELPVGATVGTWTPVGSPGELPIALPPYYSNSYKHSGSLAMAVDWSQSGDDGAGGNLCKNLGGISSQVYISYWVFIPSGMNVPGESGGLGANWKTFWLTGYNFATSDYVYTILGANGQNDWNLSIGAADDGNSPTLWGYVYIDYDTPCYFRKGKWFRVEFWIKAGQTDGDGFYYQTSEDSGGRIKVADSSDSASGPITNTQHSGEPWYHLHFPGFARHDENSITYYDDIYVSTGSYARARVEIGNNSTYSNCTNLSVITPTSWSNESITATVRQGSFSSGTAYLFVVDANGNASSGYAVTVVSGGGDTTAPSVAITTADPSSTTSDSLSIIGTASDAVGVTSVTCSSNRGGTCSCSGTTSFTCTAGLKQGANIITVTAVDAASNNGTDTVTINAAIKYVWPRH